MTPFHKLLVHIQAFLLTLAPSESMSEARRELTVKRIGQLAQLRGIDNSVALRVPLTREAVRQLPKNGGVYRVYEGDELRYIGVSGRNIRRRLRRHVRRSEESDWIERRELYLLISSGANFEYYLTPYPGWMEDHELTAYDHPEQLLNRQKRGNRVF